MKIINRLLITDLLVMIIGIILLIFRPYGIDITFGIATITGGFVVSVLLFLIKSRGILMDE